MLVVFQAVQNILIAMAGKAEINSFVGKFVSLWHAGRNVSLNIESKAGKATVIIQL